jgi:hypothetical protein
VATCFNHKVRHLWAIKVYKIKITVAKSFCMGRMKCQSLSVAVYMSISRVKTLYTCQYEMLK